MTAENYHMKTGSIFIGGDNPMHLVENGEPAARQLTEEEQQVGRRVTGTLKAYLNAAEELLADQYAHLRELAPLHLRDPGNVLVACCTDGVIVRYEKKAETTQKRRIFHGRMEEGDLPATVRLLSQGVIHCYRDSNFTSTIPTTGIEIKLSTYDPVGGKTQDFTVARVGFDAVLEQPAFLPRPPKKPFCLLSVRNHFEFHMVGELASLERPEQAREQFITRSGMRLPIGWECIEVFPFLDVEAWKPEYASAWAETDLLAAVVAHQFREANFQSLDPNNAVRANFARLLRDFKNLLDSNPEREEVLQKFLKDHPALLCPVQTGMWPKLALGGRETDFVFKEAAGDYLLVELERSTLRLFVKSGDPSSDLSHARKQVTDWKRYLEDNSATVQRELGLVGISVNPKALIVIGRSQSLSADDRRALTAMENETPRVKIMTYDDVYDNAKAVVENLLGPILEVVGMTQIYFLRQGGSH
jgi:hypothetical protein